MKYVTLGKTGLRVSALSLGGIPIQRTDEAGARLVIDKILECGINFIDTARGYTVSEEYIGAALEGRREGVVLATKSMARDYESMKKDVETSLANLRTDYIDLYQLHNPSLSDLERVFSDSGAYRALEQAKVEGKIGHIGVTNHSVEALETLVEKYSEQIETVMFPFNIVENQGEQALRAAKAKGMGTIAMKPLAGGNIENAALALRYIAASGVCDVAIPGMGSPSEVESNAAALDDESPLSEKEIQLIQSIKKELGSTFCRRCGYCAPCTVGINIPGCFLFANYLHKYDLADWARGRYAAMAHKASECIECGECESRCPYELPIREMLKSAAKDFGE